MLGFWLGVLAARLFLSAASKHHIMKKTILLLGLAAFSAGCSQSNQDSAKIDALSQKLDLISSNQAVLFNEIEAVKIQVTNLPDVAFYYHTNEMHEMLDRFNTVDEANRVTHDADKWIMNMQLEMATNKVF